MAGNDVNGSRHRLLHAAAAAFLLILALTIALTPLNAAEGPKASPAAKAGTAPDPMPSPDSLAARIAERYGVQAFEKVKSIHYVFNVHFKDMKMKRGWTWFPKQDSVLYDGDDPKGLHIQAAYSRRNPYSMKAENVVAIDKSFVNDQYWLLFPLHLAWDKDIKLKLSPGAKPGEAYRLTVTYPSNQGYTPGDAYDLFVDSDAMLMRWIYRKGNASQPTREAMWSKPEMIKGVGISMEHPGSDKDFKLWFTDVKIEAETL